MRMVFLPLAPVVNCVLERVGASSGLVPDDGRRATFCAALPVGICVSALSAGPDRRRQGCPLRFSGAAGEGAEPAGATLAPARPVALGVDLPFFAGEATACAVLGAELRLFRAVLFWVTVGMTLTGLGPDSSHLAFPGCGPKPSSAAAPGLGCGQSPR